MKKLPQTFRKNQFDYELVNRNEYAAIYKQKNNGETVAYEVFEIKTNAEKTVKLDGQDVHYKAGERIPGNEDFGHWAFTLGNKKSAIQKFNVLTQKVRNRDENRKAV